jgi:hypothetical protein
MTYTWSLMHGLKYEGLWTPIHLKGLGRITYPDGTSYEGEWNKNGIPLFDAEHPILKECVGSRCTNNVDRFPQIMYKNEWDDIHHGKRFCKFCAINCQDVVSNNTAFAYWSKGAGKRCTCNLCFSSTKKQKT